MFQISTSTVNLFASQRPFAVQKRDTPVVTYYNPSTGAINSIRDASASTNFAVSGNAHAGTSGVGTVVTSSSVVAGNQYQAHYAANAEL
jgi:hypothetical protein